MRVGDGDWFALGSQEAVRAALGVPPGPDPGSSLGPRPAAGDTLAARLQVALKGEGVAFDIAPEPTRDAHGWLQVGFAIRVGQRP